MDLSCKELSFYRFRFSRSGVVINIEILDLTGQSTALKLSNFLFISRVSHVATYETRYNTTTEAYIMTELAKSF